MQQQTTMILMRYDQAVAQNLLGFASGSSSSRFHTNNVTSPSSVRVGAANIVGTPFTSAVWCVRYQCRTVSMKNRDLLQWPAPTLLTQYPTSADVPPFAD
jgi:hypothetical protein